MRGARRHRRLGRAAGVPALPLIQLLVGRTVGDRIADGLAAQMTPKLRRRFARALTTIKAIGDEPAGYLGSMGQAEEIMIVFADADPCRGYDGASYSLPLLRARRAELEPVPCVMTAAAQAVDRFAQDLVAGRVGGALERRTAEARHADTVEFASRLTTDRHLAQIGKVLADKRVPVLAIVGDTRHEFGRGPKFFVSVGSLPWLPPLQAGRWPTVA